MTKPKRLFDKLSITQEITISVIALIFLMIVILGSIVANSLIKSNNEAITWQKQSNKQIATGLLTDPIWTVDTNNIQNAADTFVKEDNLIIAVRVLDEFGETLVESKASEYENDPFIDLLKKPNTFLDQGEIKRQDISIGKVQFIYSTQKFSDELIMLLTKLGIAFIAVGLGFGTLILWRMEKTITAPVKRTVDASKKIASGDYQFQVEEEAALEFQQIAKALNTAIRAINERDLELKRQINKAEEATKAKSNFVSTMSHEIRTPLNAIIGLTELTLDSELSNDQRDNLETAKLSADSLLGIINDILDFSKIEAGKMELEFVEFSAVDVLLECEKMLSLSARKKLIDFKLHYNSLENYSCVGDPLRLKQILLNLMNNAIKFTDQKGLVHVRLSKSESSLRFEIQDSGIGIEKSKMVNLFEAFRQEDQSITRKFGGTGLGLSIAKKLVDLMQGEIGVDSVVGIGSTFWFEISLMPKKMKDRAFE